MVKVCIVASYAGSVVGFRGDLIRRIVDVGHDVTVLGESTNPAVVAGIEGLNVKYRHYSIQRNSLSVNSDWRTFRELRKAFAVESPRVILAYTIKPVIWGGLAAGVCPDAHFFPMITGLGYAFQGGQSLRRQALTSLVTLLYRRALRKSKSVIFQNADNRDAFISRKIVAEAKCRVVAGSGVNLEHYTTSPVPSTDPVRFLLIARLLGEKGIREYAAAASIVKQKYPEAVFQLVGPPDSSPDAISEAEVLVWKNSGVIDYAGPTSDVRPYLNACHVYVLPSYHEGMPRTVLEAMAIGRPILTTDVCGCKETVSSGKNGWLVPAGDSNKLADRMVWFLENRSSLQQMANESRQLAEDRFDVKKVNDEMLEILGLKIH